jgi:hypothetical protein
MTLNGLYLMHSLQSLYYRFATESPGIGMSFGTISGRGLRPALVSPRRRLRVMTTSYDRCYFCGTPAAFSMPWYFRRQNLCALVNTSLVSPFTLLASTTIPTCGTTQPYQ